MSRYFRPLQSSRTEISTVTLSKKAQIRRWATATCHREAGAVKTHTRAKAKRPILLPRIASPNRNDSSRYVQMISTQAYIALGSNVGDRIENIENALRLMRQKGLKIMKVSNLYETKAMYYEDQASFLNGACKIETSSEPLALLDTLQDIEQSLGRVKLIDKGPRNIDLDILLYGSEQVSHERLHVPHMLMLEREFVLKPLLDIYSESSVPSFYKHYTLRQALDSLENLSPGSRPFSVSVLDLRYPFINATDPGRPSYIMAILNLTPDSFSDGGVNDSNDPSKIRETVRRFIANGAAIIDIGGQSTRPTADLLTAEEELSRILPIVKHVRSMPEAKNLLISIDTFYAKVAQESIAAGAHIINDISGGLLDRDMLPMVASLGRTIVLMHMRGTPQTMTKLADYPTGLLNEVAAELEARVEAAEAAGIPRWRIILDPGIGFAKNHSQNLELLRKFDELRAKRAFNGLPWLIGISRKAFIGRITGVQNASERVWGTAAGVTASIAGGADIIRVHDVAEMAQVAKLADAIYRTREAT